MSGGMLQALANAPDPTVVGLQRAVHEWANDTFPERQPAAAWLKLFEELGEVIKAPHDPMEWGDVFIMLFDLATMNNVDVYSAVLAKLEVNKCRVWMQLESGIFQHTDAPPEAAVPPIFRTGLLMVPTDNHPGARSVFEDGPYESEALGRLVGIGCIRNQSNGEVQAWIPEDGSGGCYVMRAFQIDPISAGGTTRLYYRWNADGVPF